LERFSGSGDRRELPLRHTLKVVWQGYESCHHPVNTSTACDNRYGAENGLVEPKSAQ
jgi:hypothetical protein